MLSNMSCSTKLDTGSPAEAESSSSSAGDRDALNATMASGLRKLRNSVVSLAVFFLLIVGLLLAVPGLRATGDQITDAQVGWVLGGVGLEVLSCAGYVVLFELVFGRLGRSLTSRLSLSELAVNSVVSVSGLAGIALGAWVLRSKGFSLERIARRSVLIFVLTAAVALATIVATIALASWARRAAERRDAAGHGRLTVALSAVGGGVQEALGLISEHDWRLLGALGYWLFDNLVLFACFAAFGHAPSFWVIAMAYLVGMLANSLPVPGGFIAVEGGLVGMLLLFHIRPGSAVIAAVVLYRAISLWIPSIVGGIAFFSLRQEIGKPLIVSSEAQAGG